MNTDFYSFFVAVCFLEFYKREGMPTVCATYNGNAKLFNLKELTVLV